jgi:hypothetical protein
MWGCQFLAGMVAHHKPAEARSLQALRQGKPRPQVSRLGLHADGDVRHRINLPLVVAQALLIRRQANRGTWSDSNRSDQGEGDCHCLVDGAHGGW